MSIGLAMLVLIAAWISVDKQMQDYSRDWVPSRVTSKSQNAALFAETWALQGLHPAAISI